MILLTLGVIKRPTTGLWRNIIMQRLWSLVRRLRPTILPSAAAFSRPPPAPLPAKKTGDIASTATKTLTLSEIVGTHLFMRAAV